MIFLELFEFQHGGVTLLFMTLENILPLIVQTSHLTSLAFFQGLPRSCKVTLLRLPGRLLGLLEKV